MKLQLVLAVLAAVAVKAETDEELLRQKLLNGYDPGSVPPRPVTLNLGFTLMRFEMNEEKHSIDTDLWLMMEWNDARLRWDENTTGFDAMNFRPEAIWTPDLTLYNNAEPINMENYARSNAVCSPSGTIIWIPASHGKAYCAMDMTYWPRDSHSCVLKYGSWTQSSKIIHLVVDGTSDVDLSLAAKTLEWTLLDSYVTRESKYYKCCPDEYASIHLHLNVQRNSEAYYWTVQCPIVVLCMMTVLVFVLPPCSSEKIFLGSFTLLINFVFLLKLTKFIGHASNHTPIIIQLVSRQLWVTTCCVALTALISRMTKPPNEKPFPPAIKNILRTVAPCFFLGGYAQKVTDSAYLEPDEVELNTSKQDLINITTSTVISSKASWLLLAAFVDRICLIIFSVIFIYLLSWYANAA